jgi:membrane-bound lytic murein transglycosylase F
LIRKIIFIYSFLITVLTSCSSFNPSSKNNISSVAGDGLDSIRKTEKTAAVTEIYSTNNFIYRNEPVAVYYARNGWTAELNNSASYARVYNKYFKHPRSNIFLKGDFYALHAGNLSVYDDLIRKFSVLINWDWRLLASLIFQESRFDPDVRSVAGAYGLMQIMPVTGRNFGIDITSSPENNIKAGIKYITWLFSIFNPKIPDENERINFILAAYNAGPGHILDAMNLAKKNGMDPVKWDGNVAVWLQKKSEPEYYNDIDVKNGYFRGTQSVAFVKNVLDKYTYYKNIIPR